MMNKLTNIAMVGIIFWVFIVLVLNFVVPHSLLFEYKDLQAEPFVCRHETQAVTGERWARFNTQSSGVDEIFPVGVNLPEDRYSWPDGFYEKGSTVSTWRPIVSVEPGEYVWKTTQLKLYILRIFPVYLDEDERPVSNSFTVVNCKVDQDIKEAVFSAMEEYIELEGYVIE